MNKTKYLNLKNDYKSLLEKLDVKTESYNKLNHINIDLQNKLKELNNNYTKINNKYNIINHINIDFKKKYNKLNDKYKKLNEKWELDNHIKNSLENKYNNLVEKWKIDNHIKNNLQNEIKKLNHLYVINETKLKNLNNLNNLLISKYNIDNIYNNMSLEYKHDVFFTKKFRLNYYTNNLIFEKNDKNTDKFQLDVLKKNIFHNTILKTSKNEYINFINNNKDRHILYWGDLYIKPIIDLIPQKNIKDQFFVKTGDNSKILEIPNVFCKSKKKEDNKSILFKLNEHRHFNLNDFKNVFENDINYNKKKNRIVWRGATTGHNQRFSLINNYFNKYDFLDVGFSKLCQGKNNYNKFIKKELSIKEQLDNKFIISIEGNDVASGLKWQLLSNSVVFMPKPKITSWFMEDKLISNYHYIEIKDDFSDLIDKYNWAIKNETKCIEIAKNSSDYTKKFLDFTSENNLKKEILDLYFKNVL
jgi:hypothetical protein